MTTTRILPALLALSAAACGSGFVASDPAVEVATDRAAYAPGDTVRVTLRNVSGETLGYNLCISKLDRRAADAWTTVDVFPGPGGACSMELRTLPAGESVQVRRAIPAATSAGTYRIVYNGIGPLRGEGRNRDVATPAFTVQR
ncbi:MAG: hypothetical protein ICV87_14880 [Gemmatimonadetes bacterium]|nr:hypothetical protein [Gemmatimonadota bacterium]